jgi:hypothetical protein
MKGRYQLNVFDLSLWSSFGHPLITYPDCSLGPIAEVCVWPPYLH